MSKKSNKGKSLPDLRKCRDTVTVECPEEIKEINELDDCCTLLKTGESALFYEKMHENDYYWLFFMADQDEVMACHLEGGENDGMGTAWTSLDTAAIELAHSGWSQHLQVTLAKEFCQREVKEFCQREAKVHWNLGSL